MDERKKIIRELEDRKRTDIEARSRLLEGLGETMLQRIGEGEPFPATADGQTPGGILADYRKLQKEIADSAALIKGLEEDTLKLKALEGEIFAKEEEHSQLEKELGEIYVQLGKALIRGGAEDLAGTFRQQEETLLARIEEQDLKLRELEAQEGGILSRLGKNAQIAVSKALQQKNKSALQRIYRSTGEQFLSARPEEALNADVTAAAVKASELKTCLSSVAAELSGLKGERRNMGDFFNIEGSPSRRIQGLEKHIVHTRGEFPAVYLRFGSLAAASDGKEALSSFMREEDSVVLEKAEGFKNQIAEKELEIGKIRAAISIDNEKAEIEKIKKAIVNQKQKIAAANDAISDFENQIGESEKHIEELKAFIDTK